MTHRLRLIAFGLTGALLGIPATALGSPAQQKSPPADGAPTTAPRPAPTPQSPAPTPSTPAATEPLGSSADLSRIRHALSEEPALTLDAQQLRFYLEIIGRRQSFADFVKGYDFINGPTKRGNPMTHQEFLNMVTPKEMYSSAGITATDMLQFAVTNWLGKALITKALEDLQKAKTDREAREIRDRITRELDALDASSRK